MTIIDTVQDRVPTLGFIPVSTRCFVSMVVNIIHCLGWLLSVWGMEGDREKNVRSVAWAYVQEPRICPLWPSSRKESEYEQTRECSALGDFVPFVLYESLSEFRIAWVGGYMYRDWMGFGLGIGLDWELGIGWCWDWGLDRIGEWGLDGVWIGDQGLGGFLGMGVLGSVFRDFETVDDQSWGFY